ncbi:TIGR01459 family HAD-type hydrolase [Vibrio sp. Y20_XG_PY13]|uniref:TIGR01459 family HAD-type hydrolase n=1 Tax=Vibrio sp. Y20_XG_PY13 TaxID=2957761 RepID=UPI0020A43E1E|nr:TIGR01459 family HAD-type hydrolase [Vibrio sp. Y20_XG_PY13]
MTINDVKQIKLGGIPQYDTYLVDVWGVIYDGHKLIASGIKLLDELMKYGEVILLSNTSRTATELTHMLESKGMDTSDLSGVITSGTLAQKEIKAFIKQNDSSSFYHIGSIEPSKWLHELPAKMSDNIDTSDIVICSNLLTDTEEKLIQLTNQIKEKSLPVFITNPDKKVFISGEIHMSAGVMTDYCESNDIKVSVYGKPETSIFLHAIESIGAKKQTTCMVGDSLNTDILGANQCGIDSILVQSNSSISQTEPLTDKNQPTYRVFL